jgi:hypothetical protein
VVNGLTVQQSSLSRAAVYVYTGTEVYLIV